MKRCPPLRLPIAGLFVVGTIALGTLAWASPLLAQVGDHGAGHAENHDWYLDLKQPDNGYPCCNGSAGGINGDCRPTRAYADDAGAWHALMDGRWVIVPPRVILQTLAPDGRSHICANTSGTIYCFIPNASMR